MRKLTLLLPLLCLAAVLRSPKDQPSTSKPMVVAPAVVVDTNTPIIVGLEVYSSEVVDPTNLVVSWSMDPSNYPAPAVAITPVTAPQPPLRYLDSPKAKSLR